MKSLRRAAFFIVIAASCSPSAEPPAPQAGASQAAAPAALSDPTFFPAPKPGVEGERFDLTALQVEYFLSQTAAALESRAGADLLVRYAPHFEGVPLLAQPTASPSVRRMDPQGLAWREVRETQASSTVSPAQATAAFIRDRVDLYSCRLKMPELEVWERGVFGKLRLEANARHMDGSWTTTQETHDAVLEVQDGEYRFSRLRRLLHREVHCRTPFVRDVTASLGIRGRRESGPGSVLFPYELVRGAAAGDLNDDGFPDVILVSPFEIRLLQNERGMRFRDVSTDSGLKCRSPASGALLLDFDGDGDLDILVSQLVGDGAPLGQPDPRSLVVWRNEGGMKFTDATEQTGIRSEGPATSLAAADFDLDGDVDLYLCMYGGDVPGQKNPHPPLQARNATPNQLWVNQGGRFEERGATLGVADTGWSLAAAWGDLDGDLYPDLYVANDFGRHTLYRNRRERFEEVPADQGFGMGVSWGDYDNDGDLDAYVSNMYSNAGKRLLRKEGDRLPSGSKERMKKSAAGNTLYRNDGGTLVDVTESAGVAAGGWAWCNAFVDVDNDGWQDLYVVNGYISGISKRDS